MADIFWKRASDHRLKMYIDEWYVGEVYTSNRGWTTICQLTRKDNMLPCEMADFDSAEDARDALEEQAMVMYIATPKHQLNVLTFHNERPKSF